MATPLVAASRVGEESVAKQELRASHGGVRAAVVADPGLRATPEHCAFCFDVIIAHFKDSHEPPPKFSVDFSCPLFVTWDTYARGSRALRGCIGSLSPVPIESLADYSRSSAFRDRRFSPIEEHELPHLQCAVSLLVDYKDAQHIDDWEVGIHGILIEFYADSRQKYSATYLPEVASEQGWTKDEAIRSLMRKAGYRGSVSPELLANVKLTTYRSCKCHLSYADYSAMKNRQAV